jgi:predicted acylesterase/phospholipase RssA
MTTLVLSGGSLDGIAFIGAIKRLEEDGALSRVRNFVGSSFGALLCMYLALGVGWNRALDEIMGHVRAFRGPGDKLGALVRAYDKLGILDGDAFMGVRVRGALKEHAGDEAITFLDFAKRTGKHLIVTGADLTAAKTVYYSVSTTPDMPVWLAVRISTAIPLVFTPVIDAKTGHVLVDGGVFDNFPVDFEDVCRGSEGLKDTIAMTVSRKPYPGGAAKTEPVPAAGTGSVFHYLQLLVSASLKRMNERAPDPRKMTVIDVCLPPCPDGTPIPAFCWREFTFKMDDSRVEQLVQLGYDSASRVLHGPEALADREPVPEGERLAVPLLGRPDREAVVAPRAQ